MTLKQIQRTVSKEAAAFRRETKKLTPSQVYDKAYDINIVEQIVYAICECSEYYEDDADVRRIISKLCAEACFLREILKWASSENQIDVSNADKALESLQEFCFDYDKSTQDSQKLSEHKAATSSASGQDRA